MATTPRTPAEHYAESERYIDIAEAAVHATDGGGIALLAICHALLAAAPRRAKRPERRPRHGDGGQLPPSITWGGK